MSIWGDGKFLPWNPDIIGPCLEHDPNMETGRFSIYVPLADFLDIFSKMVVHV